MRFRDFSVVLGSLTFSNKEIKNLVLGPGWGGSLVGYHNQRVAGSIPSEGTCLGCRFIPSSGTNPCSVCEQRQPIDTYLASTVLSPFLSL